ncbi:MAG: transcription antitermination factor NusB [Bdellovibrionota bacterium]
MSNRHKAREIALQILYRHEYEQKPDLAEHFEHFQVPEQLREYIGNLVSGVLKEKEAIDKAIETHASNWKMSRMALVDRSLLRLAVYELLFCPDMPVAIVIDEAVELAKSFAAEETPAFINGILDAVSKSSVLSPRSIP